jgi:putative FmdB family regulatory protein
MPIYEYECSRCEKTFEALQKFSDSPLTRCILCNGGPVKKLISASAFVLKGSGFYVNDYASGSRNNGGESKKSENSEKKSESKPESKSESKSEATKTDIAAV